MNVAVEVSMYPLHDEFLPPIDAFLAELNGHAGIEVTTNRMSTQLFGDYDQVMELVKTATRQAHEQFGKAVFVYKVIPGASRTINGYE